MYMFIVYIYYNLYTCICYIAFGNKEAVQLVQQRYNGKTICVMWCGAKLAR